MFSGMASLSLSSALWFTAMAANPLGAEMARSFGVTIDFGSWLLAVLGADAGRDGADAVAAAADHGAGGDGDARRAGGGARALAALGPLSRDERIVAVTFVGMVGALGVGRDRSASTRRPSRCSASASCSRPAC